MPKPIARGRRYMPGLDGLRAFAVCAVIVYHLGFGWASGGLLGVAVFFTLSGYLITDLLLGQHAAGGIDLKGFWLARARRLLPALLLMLLVVSIWVWADDRHQLTEVRGQVFAGLLYISNWWQSFDHISYFARFGPPSPLNHLWSLAIEEQFYLLWPWLLLAGLHFVKEREQGVLRPRLALWILGLALLSAIEMAILYHPGFDPSRVYYGTDTRAFGLLIGAALACVWPSRSLNQTIKPQAVRVLDVVGVFGLIGLVVLILATSEYSASIYRGGLFAVSVFTAMVVAAVTHPASRFGRVMGIRPLRWIGVRSYGIYLWHAPIIALTTPNPYAKVDLWRAAAQVLATFAVAALSWHFVEEPVRHGALGRTWRRVRSGGLRSGRPRRWALVFGAALLVAVLGITGAVPPLPIKPVVADTASYDRMLAGGSTTGKGNGSSATSGIRTVTSTTPGVGIAGSANLKSSCRSVVHIGDSTSEGLISNQYLPDTSQQSPGQYARVGVRTTRMEVTGGTSIVETLPGSLNAQTVAQGLIAKNYDGCWVIALGTNDVADVAVGSTIPLAERIDDLMNIIGNQDVLWVNTKTLLASGPYAESGMQQWNQALVSACSQYPNMRVYDWAAAVQDKWFIADGIHYYSNGYAARAYLIADALALAFPAHGKPPANCLVETGTVSIPVRGLATSTS